MLSFDKISLKVPSQEILQDVSFAVKPHTLTAIIGKNGSGKTSLVSCIIGERKYKGSITYEGKDLRLMPLGEKGRLISVLPQILPSPHITVRELVRMGRSPYLDIGKTFTKEDLSRVAQAIADTGITDIEHKYLTELSGGERQKAYVAMVLAQNTRVIVMDEPTTYMDVSYAKELMALINEMKTKKKKTILAVMHDINRALEYADNILLLHEGKVVFYGTAKDCADSGKLEEIFNLKRRKYICDGENKVIFI